MQVLVIQHVKGMEEKRKKRRSQVHVATCSHFNQGEGEGEGERERERDRQTERGREGDEQNEPTGKRWRSMALCESRRERRRTGGEEAR